MCGEEKAEFEFLCEGRGVVLHQRGEIDVVNVGEGLKFTADRMSADEGSGEIQWLACECSDREVAKGRCSSRELQ